MVAFAKGAQKREEREDVKGRKRKRIRLVAITTCICIILGSTSISFGATKYLSGKHSELFWLNSGPTCTVNVNAHVTLTYTDTTTTRKYTKHCYDMLFTSPNGPEVTSDLSCSMGILCHYNPGQVQCPNNPAYSHAQITPLPYIAHKHSDSGKTVLYRLRSNGYCQVAYAISGGGFTTHSYVFKFSDIAK